MENGDGMFNQVRFKVYDDVHGCLVKEGKVQLSWVQNLFNRIKSISNKNYDIILICIVNFHISRPFS